MAATMTSPILGKDVEMRLSPPSTPMHSWWSSVTRNSPAGTLSPTALAKTAASPIGRYPPAVWPMTLQSPPRTPDLGATRSDSLHLPGNALDATAPDVLASVGGPRLSKNHFTQSWTGPLRIEPRKMSSSMQSLPTWPARPAGRSTLEKEHPSASGFLAYKRFLGEPVPWTSNDGMVLMSSPYSGKVPHNGPQPHLPDLRRPRRGQQQGRARGS
mmetsp:Transcript_64023/g.152685  ORF Transcript_64023/g.152685 Transcript_64023/m.152685 type:complete len:214 (+) Transcript_64023:96-737(+)